MSRYKRLGIMEASGLILSIVGTGVQLRWPEQKWLGTAIIIAGVAVMFGVLIWWVAQRAAFKEIQSQSLRDSTAPQRIEQRQHAPINNNPVFTFAPTINQSQSQKQDQHIEHPARAKPPVFEPTRNTRVVRYVLDRNNNQFIREPYHGPVDDLPDDKVLIHVALAQFLYRPDVGVEPYLYVSAHVFLYDADNNILRPANYKAVWDDTDFRWSMDFYAGNAHDLIIALVPFKDPIGIFLYEYNVMSIPSYFGTDSVVAPSLHPIEGKTFTARVELILKRVNDPLPKQTFWFTLSLEPKPNIAEIDTPSWSKTGQLKG